MPGYYDYVLAFVPLALVGVTAGLGAIGVDFLVAVPVGAAAASLAVGHALFVNSPVDDRLGAAAADSHGRSTTATDRSPMNAD